ncbi:MAG: DUF192 domain-containing protein [Patescibacteria group bacterium]
MIRLIIVLVLILIFCFIVYFYLQKSIILQESKNLIKEQPIIGPTVVIKSIRIPVLLAKTDEEIQKGLSGMISLEKNKGMLFIFSQSYVYRFWMKDMMFPIDIIWINNNKVVDIENNVLNNFDISKPHFYTPRTPVNFVLEVNARFASENKIKIGDTISFIEI